MIELQEGLTYEASFVKDGQNERGQWQIVKVADPNPKSKMSAAFFTQPVVPGLAAHDKIKIEKYVRAVVKKKQMKMEQSGNTEWVTVTDLTFEISKVGSGNPVPRYNHFGEVDTSGELPF